MRTAPDLSAARWRKSSRSTATSDCVEVAFSAQAIGVRDSKDPEGAILAFPVSRWAEFVRSLQR